MVTLLLVTLVVAFSCILLLGFYTISIVKQSSQVIRTIMIFGFLIFACAINVGFAVNGSHLPLSYQIFRFANLAVLVIWIFIYAFLNIKDAFDNLNLSIVLFVFQGVSFIFNAIVYWYMIIPQTPSEILPMFMALSGVVIVTFILTMASSFYSLTNNTLSSQIRIFNALFYHILSSLTCFSGIIVLYLAEYSFLFATVLALLAFSVLMCLISYIFTFIIIPLRKGYIQFSLDVGSIW